MPCGTGRSCGGPRANICGLVTDPCYRKLCCTTRRSISFKPFCPSYERCEEEVKMGKLLGMDYQRRWFCERNVWMCEVYGQCGGSCCC